MLSLLAERHAFTERGELYYIIGGHCRLNDTGGTSKTFRTGDGILTQSGIRGHRAAVETITKHFVIRRHPEAQPDP